MGLLPPLSTSPGVPVAVNNNLSVNRTSSQQSASVAPSTQSQQSNSPPGDTYTGSIPGGNKASGQSLSLTLPTQLQQNQIGDCTVLSGINSVIANEPNAIKNDVTVAGSSNGGTDYKVQLFVNGQEQSFSVNSQTSLPEGHANGNQEGEALEAAIIQANGGIDAIKQSDVDPATVLTELTGQGTAEGNSDDDFNAALTSVQQGGAAEVGTNDNQQDGWYNSQTGDFDGNTQKSGDVYIYADHEYGIDHVDNQAMGSRGVTLNNPWNSSGNGESQFTLSEAAVKKIFGFGASYTVPSTNTSLSPSGTGSAVTGGGGGASTNILFNNEGGGSGTFFSASTSTGL